MQNRATVCKTSLRKTVWCGLVLGALVASLGAVGSVSEASDATRDRLDLNRATVEELVSLPGVGEATANRIVEFREQHGPFRRVEDLMKVKGIGEKSFQKLRPLVTVATTTEADAPPDK